MHIEVGSRDNLPSLRLDAANPGCGDLQPLADSNSAHQLVFLFVADRQYAGKPVWKHRRISRWPSVYIEDPLLQPVGTPSLHSADEIMTKRHEITRRHPVDRTEYIAFVDRRRGRLHNLDALFLGQGNILYPLDVPYGVAIEYAVRSNAKAIKAARLDEAGTVC